MKTSLALVVPVVIVSLFQQNVQAVDSSCDNTYPYKHISKYSTAEYACWYQQCTDDMAKLKDFQAAAFSHWDLLAATLRDDAEVVRQFYRLETIFQDADYYNLTQCKQDFPEVLQLQKAVYNNVFNVCELEATKQYKVNYTSNMNAIKNVLMYLDTDTHQQVNNCGSDSDCKQKVESAALDQLKYQEDLATILIGWSESIMLFDNENSVRECVEFKTFEQVGDIKKIVNTVRECISSLIVDKMNGGFDKVIDKPVRCL